MDVNVNTNINLNDIDFSKPEKKVSKSYSLSPSNIKLLEKLGNKKDCKDSHALDTILNNVFKNNKQ